MSHKQIIFFAFEVVMQSSKHQATFWRYLLLPSSALRVSKAICQNEADNKQFADKQEISMKQTASGFLPASCRFFALLIL
jgi:hypothetical protein